MNSRRCDHNTTTHDYATPLHHSETLRIERVCDACNTTLQTFHATTEGAT